MPEITSPAAIADVLRSARTIAVLGAHHDPSRPACYVPAYLRAQGYRILPVNPALAGELLWDEPVRATLASITDPVDIVDVFRHPAMLAGHLDDLRAMNPRPRLVWLQLGVRDDAFVRAVTELGIDAVQDRCTLADHRAMLRAA